MTSQTQEVEELKSIINVMGMKSSNDELARGLIKAGYSRTPQSKPDVKELSKVIQEFIIQDCDLIPHRDARLGKVLTKNRSETIAECLTQHILTAQKHFNEGKHIIK